jgi:hypothetical protein
MMNLGTEESKEERGQQVAGHKAGEQQFIGKGLCIFNDSGQEFLHVRLFIDNGSF